MADVLKGAAETPDAGDARVRRVVSEMLLRIELGGDRVVREYSRALDGRDPPEFRVGADEIERASAQLSAELKEHIAFALAQVRAFAARQRERHPPGDAARDRPTTAMTLGRASGVIGTLLAMEVMHLLVDDAPVATDGRALLVDMRTLETRWEAVERRSDCSACNHREWHGGREPRGGSHPPR